MSLLECANPIYAELSCYPQGIFTPSESSAPLQVLQTDDALHQFSASLLRIPTRAITTLPRDDNGLPTQDDEHKLPPDSTPSSLTRERSSDLSQQQAANYGGNWILGNDKGVYLRVTDSSVVAHDETDDEVEDSAAENYSFPFAATKHMEDTGADTQDEQDPDDTDNETLPDTSVEASKAALDRQHDQEAWRFFAGSIDRSRAEEILTCVHFYGGAGSTGTIMSADSFFAVAVVRKARSYCDGRMRRHSCCPIWAPARSTTS